MFLQLENNNQKRGNGGANTAGSSTNVAVFDRQKKALREQWLMDGLSQQSEEEQEAMRLQAQDEQQQSDQLQSNILR